tara:strand:- start:1090 stop:1953 length:864 start_codon:yes stop_codon:yes gene_type:complete
VIKKVAKTAILQLTCPDRPRLVSELAGWVANNGGNIFHSDHHTDHRAGIFLSRIEWGLEGFQLTRDAIYKEVKELAIRSNGKADLHFSDEKPRVAIFVSKQSHCLLDLLWRVRSGEILMDIPVIISNHRDLQNVCHEFEVDFKYIPNTPIDKGVSESLILDVMLQYKVELIVLAKYMQILSPNFLKKFPNIINIHHSFLPAFKGSQPYHQAWERGVKVIGATAHYVTEDLDAGPIIDQQITYVSHRDEVEDLIRKGRDSERIALSRALRLHLCRQVIIYSGRTAVFA